jgi:hypothetical protein
MERGTFKTAHPGRLYLEGGADLIPFTGGTVCVKQIGKKRQNSNAIDRVSGRYALDLFVTEANCLKWASILLDLTYQFIARECETRGQPALPIPELRFTRALIAVVQSAFGDPDKAFLVEEWIDTDETDKTDRQFTKYINNRFPESCVPPSVPYTVHQKAAFLAFAQHVQWEKTQHSAFTSDYQGAGHLLTDPQITSNPYVLFHLCQT